MPIAAIAAGVARTGAVAGRAAISVGSKASNGGAKAVRTMATASSRAQQSRELDSRRSRLRQSRRQQPLPSLNLPKPSNTADQADQIDQADQTDSAHMMTNGLQPSPTLLARQAMQQQQQILAMAAAGSATQGLSSIPGVSSVPGLGGSATSSSDQKQQEAREDIIEYGIQASNIGFSTLELGTGGLGILFTFFGRIITLGYWNFKLFSGKLTYRGGLRIFRSLDPNAIGLKTFVIGLDIAFALMVLIAFAMMALVIISMLSPLILIGLLTHNLFGV